MSTWLRTWATPITASLGVIMGITGMLMFFHLAPHILKELHEWFGVLTIAAVGLHIAKNWAATKGYFRKGRALPISAVSTLMIAGLFVGAGSLMEEEGGEGGGRGAGQRAAVERMEQATLAELAPLADTSAADLVARVEAAGLGAATAESTPQAIAAAAEAPTDAVLTALFKP